MASRPSLRELWMQAGRETNPADHGAQSERYAELLEKHGHLEPIMPCSACGVASHHRHDPVRGVVPTDIFGHDKRAPRNVVDQPPPVPNDRPAVWQLVIADMQERDHVGRARYGTPLQPHNGRDALVDAYQEALDLVVYLRQAIAERNGG